MLAFLLAASPAMAAVTVSEVDWEGPTPVCTSSFPDNSSDEAAWRGQRSIAVANLQIAPSEEMSKASLGDPTIPLAGLGQIRSSEEQVKKEEDFAVVSSYVLLTSEQHEDIWRSHDTSDSPDGGDHWISEEAKKPWTVLAARRSSELAVETPRALVITGRLADPAVR